MRNVITGYSCLEFKQRSDVNLLSTQNDRVYNVSFEIPSIYLNYKYPYNKYVRFMLKWLRVLKYGSVLQCVHGYDILLNV